MLQQNYTPAELQAILTEATYHLGRVLYEEGRDYNRAVSVLTDAVNLDGQNIPALYYLGQAIRAQIEQNLYKQAEEALRTYIQKGAPIGHEDDVREFLRVRQKVTGIKAG
jgi:tetratricopeptide (TPR) repeat protein